MSKFEFKETGEGEMKVMLNSFLAFMKADLKKQLLDQIMPTIELEVEQAAVKAMNELVPAISRWQDHMYDQTRLLLSLRINDQVKGEVNVP